MPYVDHLGFALEILKASDISDTIKVYLPWYLWSCGMRVPKKMADDMAAQIVQDLLARNFIDHPEKDRLLQLVTNVLIEELMVEDKVEEEVRQILSTHVDEIQAANVQYHEMFKKVKAKLQRERNLIF